MKNNKLTTALTVLGLFCVNLLLAQTSISGTVTDAETNEPIPGVNILVQGTTEGTNTDFDGNFSFSSDQAAPFTIVISSIGFSSQSIEVTAADQVINVALQPGENLDEIIVSASRRAQKIQDAPSSVSIVSAKDIENSAVAVDPVRHLVNIPGVQIQQQSANTLNIEMRAGSGVFGSATFPILDYRFLSTPAASTFFTQHSGLSNIDIEKIEVVRGAASALYGPNVVSGVVHFMSKSAIDHPGTTIELLGGEMSTMGAAIRHAYASENKKFGYKINAKWSSGDDFELDPIEDSENIAGFAREIYQPAISNGVVDATQQGDLLLSESDLDDNFDGNPLATKYENFSTNAHLEFRPNNKTTGFISGGFAQGGALFFNSQGAGYQDGEDYWAQARVQSGGFFGLVSYNYKSGGGRDNPTFLYDSGFRQVAINSSLEAQLQYNFDVPSFLNTNFTVGIDHRDVMSDSQNTLYGRNELDDDYVITGAYLQGTSSLSDQLELTYAARADKFSITDEMGFSPRVALVYKMDENNSFRATYNSSTSIPTALQLYIDFPVNVIAPGIYDVWLAGEVDAQNFDPNANVRFPFLGQAELPQSQLAGGAPNNAIFGTLNALGASAGIINEVNTNPAYAALAPFSSILAGVLNNPATIGAITGQSGFVGSPYGPGVGYNIFNGEQLSPTDTPASVLNRVNSFEVGYKGIIDLNFIGLDKKASLGVDFYTYEQQGFTNFTAIGPAFAYIPDTAAAGPLATSIASDLTPLLRPQIEGAFAATQFPGVPLSVLQANPVFVGTVDAIAGNLAAIAGGGYAGGQTVIPAATLPVFATINSERAPNDGLTHLPAGYRKFGDQKRTHWGVDIAGELFWNDNLSFWGNTSYLSQNVWTPGADNDDGLPFSSYLNSPKFKWRAGARYSKNAIQASVSYQYDREFESNQGVYSGTVPKKNLVDANFGYTLSTGVRFDITGSNIFNFKYRAFPSMPIIGRRIIGKITFDL